MQTLIANDATLNNNFIPLEPRWEKHSDGKLLTLAFGVEKILADRLAADVSGDWESVTPRTAGGGNGFGNVELMLKYVFLTLPDFSFALSPAVSFPTNSHIGSDTMETSAGAWLTWGGRFGAFTQSHWARLFRPLELQGDLGYTHTFEHPGADQLSFDPVVDYSLPYLAYLDGRDIMWPLRNLCFFSEMNITQPWGGSEAAGTFIFVTPGMAYMTPLYQFTIGAQIPLDRASSRAQTFAIVASLIIAMDQIDPWFGRKFF